jgi:hypothetical protein
MVERFLLRIGQFSKVDVGSKNGKTLFGKAVGEGFHRRGKAPKRVEDQYAAAGAISVLDVVGEISDHDIRT